MAATAIPAGLIRALQKTLGVGRAAVYDRIQKVVNRYPHLDRRPAAILLASENNMNTSRFSTHQDRAAIRDALQGSSGYPGFGRGLGRGLGAGLAAAPPAEAPAPPPQSPARAVRTRGRPRGRTSRGEGRAQSSVWLVHGRDTQAADQLRDLLRALNLRVLEFTQAILRTREGSPYVGSVLERGIGDTGAVVVLLTPDDEVRLRRSLLTAGDSGRLAPQARPNVIFEAGMALQHNPKKVVLVQLGRMRLFSNMAGRHVVHLERPAARHELVTKLKAAGCVVDTDGEDWLTRGDFTGPRVRKPRRRARKKKRPRLR